MVSPAEDLAILVEIDQIHQQLLTRGAHEACWMPAGARPSSGGKDCHLPSIDASATLSIKDKQQMIHEIYISSIYWIQLVKVAYKVLGTKHVHHRAYDLAYYILIINLVISMLP